MFKLPSYEECLEIVAKNEAFIHKIVHCKGYKIHLFNYMLAQYSDFANPIEGSSVEAFELRGLPFLEYEGVFTRHC